MNTQDSCQSFPSKLNPKSDAAGLRETQRNCQTERSMCTHRQVWLLWRECRESLLSLQQQDLDLQIWDFFLSVAASFSSQADKPHGVCVCVSLMKTLWTGGLSHLLTRGLVGRILGQNTEA